MGLLMAPHFKSREREFHDFDPYESAIDEYTAHCSSRRHLWPKILAIHSEGEDDKEFVRYLGRELGKMCYDVFDYGESYLGGREAVSSFRLVVVLLSEKFLRTKACMAEFMLVINDTNWLCLFYELSVEEFLNQSNLSKWREAWESWQGIQVYDEAAWRLRLEGRTLDCSTLSNGNTIEFMKIIAQTISSRFIPLQVHWSRQASCIQGKTRLSWEVDKCFFEGPLCDEDVRVLGLHGTWSVGKTSLAKVLCEFYSTEFQGRVYHAELLKKSSHLQLMKDLLRNLLGAKQDFLEQNLTGLGQAYAYLDHCLEQSSEQVFLVVDNIQDSWECLERARDLFLRRVPFPKGSMILCFARSSHTLEQLLLPLDKLCHIESIPSLTPREGYRIFRQVLFSDLSEGQAQLWQKVNSALEYFSILCVCLDQQPHTMGDVHPLRFKSLGYFFREKGAHYWLSAFAQKSADAIFKDIQNLAKWKEDNYLKTVFKALHEIYDSLDRQVQQMFIDIALYVPRRDLSWLCRLDHDKDAFFSSGFECLQKLRAVTLLTLEERKIEMHSLCRSFAEKVARHSEAHVYVVGETVRGTDVCNMLNHRADVIERMSFEDCFFDRGYILGPFILDLSNCKRLQVLRLLNVNSQYSLEICLGHNKLLTLEISSISTPVIVTGDLSCVRCFSHCLDMVAGSNFPFIENLEVLEITMSKRNSADGLESHANYEKFTPHFWEACEVEVFWLAGCNFLLWGTMLPLNAWSRLRELTLFHVRDLEKLENLSSLHNLRTLHVQGLPDLKSLGGTESLSSLQEVHVIECQRLCMLWLPAGMLLNHCCIWFCDNLVKIAVCDGSVILETPVTMTRTSGDCVYDDEVDEIRRYYPCPDQDDEKMTCSDPEKFVQISFENMGFLKHSYPEGCEKFVPFSSESKFSIVQCRELRAFNGLAKLTSIKAFEFGRCTENSRLQMDCLTALDLNYLDFYAMRFQYVYFRKPPIKVSISNFKMLERTSESEGKVTHSVGASETDVPSWQLEW